MNHWPRYASFSFRMKGVVNCKEKANQLFIRKGILVVVAIVVAVVADVAHAQTTASYGGCSVSGGVQVIEVIEGACSPKVLKALIRKVGLSCSPSLREEVASLSLASSTKEGLSEDGKLRAKLLEAICPANQTDEPPLLMLGVLLGVGRGRKLTGDGFVFPTKCPRQKHVEENPLWTYGRFRFAYSEGEKICCEGSRSRLATLSFEKGVTRVVTLYQRFDITYGKEEVISFEITREELT